VKKQPHRSKAQKAALHAFQQAGTAAAAKKEHKFGASKAQRRAARHNLRTARRDVALRRAGKKPLPHKKPKLSPYDVNCCSAEAVAASLRLAGGQVGSEDMLALYWRVSDHPQVGADVEAVLCAAQMHGLNGWYPQWEPCADFAVPGMILAYDLWDGADAHAVTLHPAGGIISWGDIQPLPALPAQM